MPTMSPNNDNRQTSRDGSEIVEFSGNSGISVRNNFTYTADESKDDIHNASQSPRSVIASNIVDDLERSKRGSDRQRKRQLESSSVIDLTSFIPKTLNKRTDFRKRSRSASQSSSSIDRATYNSISESSVLRCHEILKNIAEFDWKIKIHSSIRVEILEDVALVISPHNHLVDDAWRKLRSFVTDWRLFASREKLTDIEKANCVPKITRKAAYLVVVANSRKILRKVVAAERVRLGNKNAQIERDTDGLLLQGVPLTPSPAGIRSSANGIDGPAPQQRKFSVESPVVKEKKILNSTANRVDEKATHNDVK